MLIIVSNHAESYFESSLECELPKVLNILNRLSTILSYEDKNKAFLAVKYSKKQWGQNLNTKISLYDPIKKSFPTGLLPIVEKFLIQQKIQYIVKDISFNKPVLTPEIIIPDYAYNHQKEAIRTIRQNKRCVISCATGGGKSLICTWFLQQFTTVNALIIVPKVNLSEQLYEDFVKHIKHVPINIVNSNNKFKGSFKGITVAVRNSVVNVAKKDPELFKDIQVLCVDEVQGAANESFNQINKVCINAEYRLGLTATPKEDNLLVKAFIGDISLRITEQEVIDKNIIIEPTYISYIPSIRYATNYKFKMINGIKTYLDDKNEPTFNNKPPYSEVYNNAVTSINRNKLIAEIARSLLNNPLRTGPIVIFIEWQEIHGIPLLKEFEKLGVKVDYFLNGQTSTKNRLNCISNISNNKYNLVVATNVISEGTNIVNLEFAILCDGRASQGAVIQKIGRMVRTNNNTKEACFIIDIADIEEEFYLKRAHQSRKQEVVNRYGIKVLNETNSIDGLTKIINSKLS